MSIQGSVNQLLGFGALAAGGIEKGMESTNQRTLTASQGLLRGAQERINEGQELFPEYGDQLNSYQEEVTALATGLERAGEGVSSSILGQRAYGKKLSLLGGLVGGVSNNVAEFSPDLREAALGRAQQEINSRQGTKSSLEDRIQQTKQMFNNIREGIKNE